LNKKRATILHAQFFIKFFKTFQHFDILDCINNKGVLMIEILQRGEDNAPQSFEEIYEQHFNTIYKVCFSYMKNIADAEDAVAETFVKLLKKKIIFQNAEHKKAWLLRTAINICKNNLKHWRRNNKDIDEYGNLEMINPFQKNEVLETIMCLPKRYKDVIYLYYYEGYTTEEIAQMT